MTRTIPRVLSIAGTDPTGGAGIQADLKSIAANGGYGMAVVTALVAQNTTGVRSVHLPPVAFLVEQLDAVSDDVHIDAVKIGMLANVEIISAVESWLERVRPPVVVLDPVMVATSGDRLLDADAEEAMKDLLGHADLVTPNVPELAVLAGEPPATTWSGVVEQALRVSASYGVRVLAKGGHLGGATAPDALVDATGGLSGGRTVVEFSARRVQTTSTHGTGCSLSSALATRVPLADTWETAVADSKRWLTESIEHGAGLDVGKGHGPISHFAGLWARGGTTTAVGADEVVAGWWDDIAELRAHVDGLPFLRALADGTLDRDAFVRYLAQDACYLRDYAHVLADAGRLAPTADEQAFWTARAHGTLATELALHADWLPAGHVFDAEPRQVTTAYANHLLATSARGSYAVLVAALLPCFWLSTDIGSRLRALATERHPYGSWLAAYADPVLADATRQAVAIVGRHAARSDPQTRQAMRVAFRTSCEHELEFFRTAADLG